MMHLRKSRIDILIHSKIESSCISVIPQVEGQMYCVCLVTNFPVHVCNKSRGGSGGSNEPPLEPKLFHFHGEFQEKIDKLHKSNPPQLI